MDAIVFIIVEFLMIIVISTVAIVYVKKSYTDGYHKGIEIGKNIGFCNGFDATMERLAETKTANEQTEEMCNDCGEN